MMALELLGTKWASVKSARPGSAQGGVSRAENDSDPKAAGLAAVEFDAAYAAAPT